MSELLEKQFRFVRMLGRLLREAELRNVELTLGAGYRDPSWGVGHPQSLHGSRLAVDLNLFIDGVYQTESSAHAGLGVYWESLGGSWGGRFGDGNHYSLSHGGMR